MQYKINRRMIIQKLDGRIVIFDGKDSVLYSLNETATFIFDKLKSGWDKKRIVAALMAEYDVNREKTEQDYDKLTAELLAKRVLLPISAAVRAGKKRN